MVESLLHELLGMSISIGSIQELCEATSRVLEKPVQEICDTLKEASEVFMDETGWRQKGQRMWLWSAVTPLVTVFRIAVSRGRKVVQGLIGETFRGVLHSDRWGAYTFLDPRQRQLCWAHLKRTFQGLVDRGGVGAGIGRWGLSEIERLFDTRLLNLWPALFCFAKHEGMEPTNNVVERALRSAVIWRKVSFGNQSEDGARFTERILTTVATCRQQDRNVVEFLFETIQAHKLGLPAPSLLPVVI